MKNNNPQYFDGRSLPKEMMLTACNKGPLVITNDMRRVIGANPYTPYPNK